MAPIFRKYWYIFYVCLASKGVSRSSSACRSSLLTQALERDARCAAPEEPSRDEEQWLPGDASGPRCSILLEPKLEPGVVPRDFAVEAFSLPALRRLAEMETNGLADLAAVDPKLLTLQRLERLGE